jgi:hypothetical protein
MNTEIRGNARDRIASSRRTVFMDPGLRRDDVFKCATSSFPRKNPLDPVPWYGGYRAIRGRGMVLRPGRRKTMTDTTKARGGCRCNPCTCKTCGCN